MIFKTLAAILGAVLLCPSLARAQSTCQSLLTEEELTKAAGATMSPMGEMETKGAETTCTWMLPKAKPPKRVTVIFVHGDKEFEKYVAAVEELGGTRELVSAGDAKVALVPAPPMTFVAVQRADGTARINTTGLTKPRIILIARAVAAP